MTCAAGASDVNPEAWVSALVPLSHLHYGSGIEYDESVLEVFRLEVGSIYDISGDHGCVRCRY
jgi:hypothetical protein